MIELRDAVEIDASPEQVFDWLAHLPENYLAWHPAHVTCRYLQGDSMDVGAVLYVEETLHGQLHKLKLRMTKVIPGRRMAYSIMPGMRGAFEIEPCEGKTRFVATLTIGTSLPMLGPLLDWLMRALLGRRIDAFKQHMAEEGENLRALFGP